MILLPWINKVTVIAVASKYTGHINQRLLTSVPRVGVGVVERFDRIIVLGLFCSLDFRHSPGSVS